MPELLLELFSEEIPARMQQRAAADLARLVGAALGKAELAHGALEAEATPRRLALVVRDLPAAQPDVREERRGPRADAPDKAIEGFLRSAGLTRADCEERETPKGTFLFAIVEKRGRPTADVLAEILPDVLAAVPWPKSMRWGAGPARWVRPLQRILALFDGAVVPFAFAGIDSGNETCGHRFHAPEVFAVRDAAHYREALLEARVVLGHDARRQAILEGGRALAAAEGLSLVEDDALLDEVAGLVEWPVPLLGRIDPAFMELPAEVLTTSMAAHQKYLSLREADGSLAARFLVVANLEAEDGGRAIVDGNERVLKARLADAAFFWEQDRAARLESRLPALDGVVFHARLGTLGEKVQRVEALAGSLAASVTGADSELCRRAARLAKADLTTEMVGEFPELQGIMGRYYARHDGEDEAVAEAIARHYAPAGPADTCPDEPVAIVVALADKLDTLTGFWSIDEKPTGSKDPFALRRAALGVIRLLLENRVRLPLLQVPGFDDDLLGFFADRLKVHLRDAGIRHDLIAAVFARGGEDDLVRLVDWVQALQTFLESEDGANLLTAYRRAANILRIEEKKDERRHDATVDLALLEQAEEKALNDALSQARARAQQARNDEDFTAMMAALADLRSPVDAFFDAVTVNADDPGLRANRLSLLAAIRDTLHQVGDFSLVEGEQRPETA